MDYQSVLDFWFEELETEQWFQSSEELDKQIEDTFGQTLLQARAGELAHWRKSLEGRLAEIIVLDQFSRNIYRGQGEAFASDDMALTLAQEAVKHPDLYDLPAVHRSFIYMPFMHSESQYIHEEYSLKYFAEEGLEYNWPYAKEHYETIRQFGRYSYRNKALGRETTEAEQTYLDNL